MCYCNSSDCANKLGILARVKIAFFGALCGSIRGNVGARLEKSAISTERMYANCPMEREKLGRAVSDEKGGKVPSNTTLAIADDHPTFRDGLRRLLEAEPDLKVIGEASSGAAVVHESTYCRHESTEKWAVHAVL